MSYKGFECLTLSPHGLDSGKLPIAGRGPVSRVASMQGGSVVLVTADRRPQTADRGPGERMTADRGPGNHYFHRVSQSDMFTSHRYSNATLYTL
jgi:hypothetical protein